jgi:hypothetical protein
MDGWMDGPYKEEEETSSPIHPSIRPQNPFGSTVGEAIGMNNFNRWRRIRIPDEPSVPAPASPRSKLLDTTRYIGTTGVIAREDMAGLAECYAGEDADWARFLKTLAQAHTLK